MAPLSYHKRDVSPQFPIKLNCYKVIQSIILFLHKSFSCKQNVGSLSGWIIFNLNIFTCCPMMIIKYSGEFVDSQGSVLSVNQVIKGFYPHKLIGLTNRILILSIPRGEKSNGNNYTRVEGTCGYICICVQGQGVDQGAVQQHISIIPTCNKHTEIHSF